MEKIGIKDFILNGFDFEITFIRDKKISVLFSSNEKSISKHAKSIEKKLRKETNAKLEKTPVDMQ